MLRSRTLVFLGTLFLIITVYGARDDRGAFTALLKKTQELSMALEQVSPKIEKAAIRDAMMNEVLFPSKMTEMSEMSRLLLSDFAIYKFPLILPR